MVYSFTERKKKRKDRMNYEITLKDIQDYLDALEPEDEAAEPGSFCRCLIGRGVHYKYGILPEYIQVRSNNQQVVIGNIGMHRALGTVAPDATAVADRFDALGDDWRYQDDNGEPRRLTKAEILESGVFP